MKEDKAKGCIFGALVGDCLGVTSEFMSPEQVRKFEKLNPQWPYNYMGRTELGFDIGEPTDDSELTVCLLESIKSGMFYPDIFMQKMIDWNKRGAKGVGHTIKSAVKRMIKRRNWETVGREIWLENKGNAANGSIMRLSPVPSLFPLDAELFAMAILSSIPTHYNIEVFLSCLAFSYYCAEFIEGEDNVDYLGILKRRINYDAVKMYIERLSDENTKLYFVAEEARAKSRELFNTIKEDFFSDSSKEEFSRVYNYLYERIKNAESFNPGDIPRGESGYVVHTLIMGIWAEINSNSFEEGLQMLVRCGRDADTYGAVAGAIMGAKYGFSSISERYIEPLWLKNKVNKLIET